MMKDQGSISIPRKVGFLIPIVVYLLFTGLLGSISVATMRFFNVATTNIPWLIAPFSVGSLILAYLFSHLYTKKKWWGYSGFSVLLLFPIIYPLAKGENWGAIIWGLCSVLRSFSSGILLYMVYDWFRRVRKQKELEKQNLQSELKLLKSQLNPHFLFNTLNNIDSLIHSNPDKASKSLVEMSEMMRYMIYETNSPTVNLSQELTHIENYLALQQLQYDNTELVTYKVEGSPEQIQIAPMLFIPFVENAFKHCTDKQCQAAIRFSFHITPTEIQFESANLISSSHPINKDSSSGIGLHVVKRRLDFLYPSKYELEIKEENGYFCVFLKISIV